MPLQVAVSTRAREHGLTWLERFTALQTASLVTERLHAGICVNCGRPAHGTPFCALVVCEGLTLIPLAALLPGEPNQQQKGNK